MRRASELGFHFVTPSKENLVYRVAKRRPRSKDPWIHGDELIEPTTPQAKVDYPVQLRLDTALVELDGEERVLVFGTNNLEWCPPSLAELNRCRWQIEVFFQQIKQTLQLVDLLGNNANAVKLQLWLALLVYVMLSFQKAKGSWTHRF